MATTKKTKFYTKRVLRCFDQLANDLDDMHNLGIIEYPAEAYHEQAPCSSLYELQKRFNLTTQKAFARAFVSDLRKK